MARDSALNDEIEHYLAIGAKMRFSTAAFLTGKR
jgi:hypothetical protein